tara:strand:- start:2037 stop:2747 length:711 start_codon:yes stop_codon:yes gene_type:complete
MKLVVMTPIRNGVQYLDEYFENVEKFADGVVFLDDGSTDNTYEVIKEHPLTKHIIRNPKRDTSKGWNASENLFKMHEYIKSDMKDYDWIVSMSVDCTLHPTYRIKDLMKIDYKDDFFIGFFIYSAFEDGKSYKPNMYNKVTDGRNLVSLKLKMWKNKPHYVIPKHPSIHGPEKPDGIDICFSSGCILMHHGSSSYERRVERYNKYTLEVDEDNKHQSSYDNIRPDHPRNERQPIKI